MAESEEVKSLFTKVKEESEKVGLKFNFEKTKIMASGPITSWQIDGETMETMRVLILGSSKITADGDCSYEIKRCLLFGRKVMTNLDSILESRDITLPTKVSLVKAMVFQVVMYGCKSWTIMKPEHWRTDAFELWCWRRLLRVPWIARRSNQSILKEISPEYLLWKDWCWSWSSNTLATWCEELTHWKRLWCWEGLKAGGEGDDRGWDGWMASPTQWTWVWVNSGRVGDGQGGLVCCSPWDCKESDTTEWLNWSELKKSKEQSAQYKILNHIFRCFSPSPLKGDPSLKSSYMEGRLWHENGGDDDDSLKAGLKITCITLHGAPRRGDWEHQIGRLWKSLEELNPSGSSVSWCCSPCSGTKWPQGTLSGSPSLPITHTSHWCYCLPEV